jgi:hypothetical protein
MLGVPLYQLGHRWWDLYTKWDTIGKTCATLK